MTREKEDNAKNYNKVEKITRSVKKGWLCLDLICGK